MSLCVAKELHGLGQRLSMDASGVIAYYVMDNNRPLTATTDNDTTTYLYGLGVIGEENTAWSYSLTDGTNPSITLRTGTQRQLTDSTGEVTYSARYTPWGDTLETHGTGNFQFGYFGGLMDNATGLMYVGEGQYYDPSTGRFLTRNPNANGNPYLPFDPTGALFVPLAFASLVYGRKKKKSKLDVLIILALLSLSAGVGVAACGAPDGSMIEATVIPIAPNQAEVTVSVDGTTQPPVIVTTPVPPNTIVVAICEVAPTGIPSTPTSNAIQMLTSGYYIPTESQVIQKYAGNYPVPAPSWVERPAFLVRYDSIDAARAAGKEWSKNWADGFPAQYANEGLLYHHDFICTQGSGKLDISANGHYITCDTDYYWEGFWANDAPNSWTPSTREMKVGFRWADESEDGLLESLIAYHTVAVCPGTQLRGEIQIVGLEEAQMKKLRDNRNPEAKFTVVDVGEGLYPPNNSLGEKYLDIYTGEGANAANDAVLFYSKSVQVIQR